MGKKLHSFYEKLIKFLTPVKLAALILVILGVLDHLTYFDVYGTRGECLEEALVRSFFIFCGLFALFGNGKTAKLRTFIVSIPYYYLSIFYLVSGFQLNSDSLLTLAVPSAVFAIWLNFAGYYYER